MLLRYFLILLLMGLVLPLLAQTTLNGRVTDLKGHALSGANVLLKGAYDGTSTDSTGAFRFQTSRTDSVRLVVSYVGYEPVEKCKLIYTYRYTPDNQTRYAVGPTTYRSFFVGAMLMLSRKATVNPAEL